jgi:hypothetical protein
MTDEELQVKIDTLMFNGQHANAELLRQSLVIELAQVIDQTKALKKKAKELKTLIQYIQGRGDSEGAGRIGHSGRPRGSSEINSRAARIERPFY